jgi:hypothetical protein
MDPNLNQPVSYVDPYQSGYQAPNQPVSKKSKILVVLMIVGILLLVIIGLIFITTKKDPNLANMEKVVGIHAEIGRVSKITIENRATSTKAKEIAGTAMAVSSSNQATAQKIASEEYGGSFGKDFLAETVDKANDDKLKQGELLGSVDKAYYEILKRLLVEANAAIKQANNNESTKAQLDEMAASNKIVFEAVPSSD